jgi:hypothetical protein
LPISVNNACFYHHCTKKRTATYKKIIGLSYHETKHHSITSWPHNIVLSIIAHVLSLSRNKVGKKNIVLSIIAQITWPQQIKAGREKDHHRSSLHKVISPNSNIQSTTCDTTVERTTQSQQHLDMIVAPIVPHGISYSIPSLTQATLSATSSAEIFDGGFGSQVAASGNNSSSP